jgi:hypothetical protein
MAAFCWMLIAWKELVSAPRLQWNVHTTVFGLLAGGGSASARAPDNNERDSAAATEIARMSFMTPSLRPRTYILETPAASLIRRARAASLRPLGLPQHANEHRPKRPILLAVDQRLGEGPALRVAQNSPIRSARSKSGSMRTCRSAARGTGPRASRRSRRRRSSSSGRTAAAHAVVASVTNIGRSGWLRAGAGARPDPASRPHPTGILGRLLRNSARRSSGPRWCQTDPTCPDTPGCRCRWTYRPV